MNHVATSDEPAAALRGTAVVSARGVSRVFGTGETSVQALRDVSLDIPRGQLTAVMGPSGSGKSTLMHILAGLDTPTAGRAWIDGVEVTGDLQPGTRLAVSGLAYRSSLPIAA